jgi:hypothetical protein
MSFGKLVFGILLVVIGAVLLAANQGFLPPGVWPLLIKFWPLLLVILGIALLASVLRNLIIGLLSAALIIGAFVFAGYWITRHAQKGKPVPAATVDLGKTPPRTIILRGRMICGSLTVAADSIPHEGIRITASGFGGREVAAHRWSSSGGIGVLAWPSKQGAANQTNLLFGTMNIRLPERSAVRIDCSSYLSSATADFTRLRPDPCDLRAIGSRVRLTVGGARPSRIHVHGFLSSVEIRLPANCPARVTYSSPITPHSFPDDFVEHLSARVKGKAAFWTAEGAGPAVPIEVDGALMRIKIIREPGRGL